MSSIWGSFHFEVVGASNETIEQALKIDNKDLEDNLQYLSAKNSKCEIVITNDKSFYAKEIETVSSSEFVQRYLN